MTELTRTTKSPIQTLVDQWEALKEVSGDILRTGLVPSALSTAEKIAVAILFGSEHGLQPMQTLSSVYVVNNKPALYGDLPLQLVLQSGKMASMKEEWITEDGKVSGAICRVKRSDPEIEVTRKFTFEMAKRAGLMRNKVWDQYPERMLQLRARSWALRDGFPDALAGAPIYEEQVGLIEDQDFVGSPDGGGSKADRPKTGRRGSGAVKKVEETIDAEVVA